MKRIGVRRYRCEIAEVITIKFSPDPEDCINKIVFDFDTDTPGPERVQDNEITFTFNENTELSVLYFFDPAQVDGICDVTLSGSSGGGNSPDQIDFSKIPPHVIYRFVS